MPKPPAPPQMAELDPEQSSTGLTNIVAGRLSIFEAKSSATPVDDSHSTLPTPSKEEANSDEVFEEIDVEDDGYEVVDAPGDAISAQRDDFLATLTGNKQDVKQAIGERLYSAIFAMHGNLAGKLTGMFLEASDSHADLALLLFSDSSLRYHCDQALKVLNASVPQLEAASSNKRSDPSSPTTPLSPDAPGAKRSHSHGAQQFPYNGKKAKTQAPSRPFFAEMTGDSGKRTRVPCRYDSVHKMYVPTGGRMDSVSGTKKVGTRDKTPEDLQALELGEADEGKLRARQKQIDIGKGTEGFLRLRKQGLRGRPLQDVIGLPYITEEGVLELTLKCSKKRYDGYLRMWKRKLYEFSGVQRLDFSSFPPVTPPKEGAPAPDTSAKGSWAMGTEAVRMDLGQTFKAKTAAPAKASSRKQAAPVKHAPKVADRKVERAAAESHKMSWADQCEDDDAAKKPEARSWAERCA